MLVHLSFIYGHQFTQVTHFKRSSVIGFLCTSELIITHPMLNNNKLRYLKTIGIEN